MERISIDGRVGIIKYSIKLNAFGPGKKCQAKGGEIIKFITNNNYTFKIYICREKILELSSDIYFPNTSDRKAIKPISRTLCLMLIGLSDCTKRLMIYNNNENKSFLIQIAINDFVRVNRSVLKRDQHTICLVKYIGDVPEIGPGTYIGVELFFDENTTLNDRRKLSKKYWNCDNNNGYVINCGAFFTRTSLIDQTAHQECNRIIRSMTEPINRPEHEQVISIPPHNLPNTLRERNDMSTVLSTPTGVSNPVVQPTEIAQILPSTPIIADSFQSTSRNNLQSTLTSNSDKNRTLIDETAQPDCNRNLTAEAIQFQEHKEVTTTPSNNLPNPLRRNAVLSTPTCVSNQVVQPREIEQVLSSTPIIADIAQSTSRNNLQSTERGNSHDSVLMSTSTDVHSPATQPREIEKVSSSTAFTRYRTNLDMINPTIVKSKQPNRHIENEFIDNCEPPEPYLHIPSQTVTFKYEQLQSKKIEKPLRMQNDDRERAIPKKTTNKKRLYSILCIIVLICLGYWGVKRYNDAQKARLEFEKAQAKIKMAQTLTLILLGVILSYYLLKKYVWLLLSLCLLGYVVSFCIGLLTIEQFISNENY